MRILENVPLAPMTTFQVGGPARYFAEVTTAGEVQQAVDWGMAQSRPLFVLGGGSNLVIADRGFPGLVLKIAIGGIERREEYAKQVFEAGAGVVWDDLVAQSVAEDCAGLECLSGIPGAVGGTPVQNVGAYGQEVSQTISEIQVLDLRDGQFRTLCNEACGFSYRSSIFNSEERGRFIILRVTYALERGGSPTVAYRDVRELLASRGSQGRTTVADVRHAVREIRSSKAMLIVPGDEDARSAGSFFKNPVLAPANYQRLDDLALRSTGSHIPSYPAPGQQFKVPAAWLVENAGFRKGTTRGHVAISRKHALAIVNRGGATAADIISFKNEIQRAVLETFDVQLTPEPVFVGFE